MYVIIRVIYNSAKANLYKPILLNINSSTQSIIGTKEMLVYNINYDNLETIFFKSHRIY